MSHILHHQAAFASTTAHTNMICKILTHEKLTLQLNFLSGVSDLSSRIRSLFIVGHRACTMAAHKLLYHLDCRRWSTWLTGEYLSVLVDNEHTTCCALGSLLEANGGDQRGRGIAKQRIWKLLLGLERCVGLWAVSAKSVDAETSSSERLVGVAKETGLGSACTTR